MATEYNQKLILGFTVMGIILLFLLPSRKTDMAREMVTDALRGDLLSIVLIVVVAGAAIATSFVKRS